MRFGFALPIFANPGIPDFRTPAFEQLAWPAIAESVTKAEAWGYDSVWVADHMFLGRDGAILEGWTTLAAVAGMTKRLRLGNIHLGNEFRHAPLMAKMVATLDVISAGRFELFIDPGWREREVVAYGWDWEPERRVRAERLGEALELCKLLWSGKSTSFTGRHYRLDEAICQPTPFQRPAPPIWIGEAFDEATLDLVARHADVWNSMPAGLDVLSAKLARVDQALQQRGRDPAQLVRTLETQVLIYDDRGEAERLFERFAALRERYHAGEAMSDILDFVATTNPNLNPVATLDQVLDEFVVGTAEEVTDKLAAYRDLGIDEVICWFMDFPSLASMHRLSTEVMPSLQKRVLR